MTAGSAPYGGAVMLKIGAKVVRGSGAGSRHDVPQPLSQHFVSSPQSASDEHSCSQRVLFETTGQFPGFEAVEKDFSFSLNRMGSTFVNVRLVIFFSSFF